jgi:hypothetical protein
MTVSPVSIVPTRKTIQDDESQTIEVDRTVHVSFRCVRVKVFIATQFARWRIEPLSLTVGEKVGAGAFGVVHKVCKCVLTAC